MGYAAMPDEVDTSAFLARRASEGAEVALPRVQGVELEARLWRPGDALVLSPLGIREPADASPRVDPSRLDLVVVPGVAFDRRGGRLGFGKGFYDRFLGSCPRALRVGVAFRQQIQETLPLGPQDERMDWVVGPDVAIQARR